MRTFFAAAVALLALGTGIGTAAAATPSPSERETAPALASSQTAGASLLSFSPSSVEFGTQIVGTTSAAKDVLVTNTSASTISLTAYDKTDSNDFGLSTGNCSSSMAPGSTCTMHFTFTPSENGLITGGIDFNTATGTIGHLSLTGTGLIKA